MSNLWGQVKDKTYSKVFCIGFNKTGTTSVEVALRNFGFKIGEQKVAEVLADEVDHG